MSELLCFLMTLAVAAIVGMIFYKLGFPAGAMVGALIGVGALQTITGRALMPESVKILTKTVAGLFVGMNMTMEPIYETKKIFHK